MSKGSENTIIFLESGDLLMERRLLLPRTQHRVFLCEKVTGGARLHGKLLVLCEGFSAVLPTKYEAAIAVFDFPFSGDTSVRKLYFSSKCFFLMHKLTVVVTI